ncbi:MAG: hypothetical protein H6510_17310 [Acidobacteria bacterium]|nr:hypothetical protein [Acidobacteriota bacterium]MCB9399573.1 hypothetical protein [Acidobacteriota bacterium]
MWIFLTLVWNQSFGLKDMRSFQTPPGGYDQPVAVVGEQQRFVLDRGSALIFRFNERGELQGSFGGFGREKGHFIFAPQFGADLAWDGQNLWVWDGTTALIQVFDERGNWLKSMNPNLEGAELLQLAVLNNEPIGLIRRHDTQNRQFEAIWRLSDKQKSEVFERQVQLWRTENGRSIAYAFPAHVAMDRKADGSGLIFGIGSEPNLHFWGSSEKIKQYPLTRDPIGDEDREEFLSQSLHLDQGNLDASWPPYKPFFNHILSLVEGKVLVFNQSPVFGIVKGFILSEEGRMLGQFEAFLDEGGRLTADGGHLYQISPNGSGRFAIKEVAIGSP